MKKVKAIVAGLLAGVMLFSMVGCANFKATDEKAFKKALEDELDLEEDDDYYVYEDGDTWIDDCDTMIYAYKKNAVFGFLEFDDEEAAADYFEDYYYDDFEDMIKDKDFDGKYAMSYNDKAGSGYITFNGDADSDFADDDIYGGVYCKDGIIVVAMAYSDKSSDIDNVNAFLKAIGYPKP